MNSNDWPRYTGEYENGAWVTAEGDEPPAWYRPEGEGLLCTSQWVTVGRTCTLAYGHEGSHLSGFYSWPNR